MLLRNDTYQRTTMNKKCGIYLLAILSLVSLLLSSKTSLRAGVNVEEKEGIGIIQTKTETVHRKKPILVLHLGPQKHATSYIQSTLSQEQAKNILLQDNYRYLGSYVQWPGAAACSKDSHPDILCHDWEFGTEIFEGGYSRVENPQLSEKFSRLLGELIQHNQNGILVMEQLSQIESVHLVHFPALARELLPRFRVRVVAGYRYQFDAMISHYNQMQKMILFGLFLKKFSWENGLLNENGAVDANVLPFFSQDQEPRGQVFVKQEATGKSITSLRMDSFRDVGFQEFAVYDMTSQTDPLESFLCAIVPNATNACAIFREGKFPKVNFPNPSMELDYFYLAVEAYHQKLFANSKNMSIFNVLTLVEARQKKALRKSASDFPRKCLAQERLDRLFNYSLIADRELFGVNQTRELDLIASFSKAHKKFCWVDATKVLASDGWKDWFTNTLN